jgi:hypothetical protein
MTDKPMQSIYRTKGVGGDISRTTSLNTETLDASANEVAGALAVIYGGGAAGQVLTGNVPGGMPLSYGELANPRPVDMVLPEIVVPMHEPFLGRVR